MSSIGRPLPWTNDTTWWHPRTVGLYLTVSSEPGFSPRGML